MKKIIIVMSAILLTACEGGVSKTDDGATVVTSNVAYGEVREISLSDGTKCAVLIGTQKGALTCNWK